MAVQTNRNSGRPNRNQGYSGTFKERCKSSASIAVLAGAAMSLMIIGGASAADFTVANGVTAVVSQALPNANDTGIIEAGGAIINTAVFAVQMNGVDQTVINRGTISTNGVGVTGITSTATRSIISNFGSIITSGIGAVGIDTNGSSPVVRNEGTISTTGDFAPGIYHAGNNSTLTNIGTIQTSGRLADGVNVFGTGVQITNSGTIITAGGSDGSSRGIVVSNNATVTNTGTIIANGAAASGIFSTGVNTHIINAGLISAPQNNAIFFFAGAFNDTLTLRQGSVIQGNILFGGGVDTLNVENGLALAYTFDKAPQNLNTNGAPALKSATQIVVLDDTTTLSAIDNATMDMVGGVSKVLSDRLTEVQFAEASRGARVQLANNDSAMNDGPSLGASRSGSANQSGVWAKAIGGLSELDGSGLSGDSEFRYGGIVLGADGQVNGSLRLGLFGGYALGQIDTNVSSKETDISNYFGGLYGRLGDAMDFALTAGVNQYEGSRRVLNNKAANGIETVTSDYNGYFVAPEVTLHAGKWDVAGLDVRPSILARYTYLHIDEYQEKGSAIVQGMGARNIHALDGRLQLASALIETETMLLDLRVGVDGRISTGSDEASMTAFGQSVGFDLGGETKELGGFVGAHFVQQVSQGASIFASAEFGSSTETSLRADAQIGIRVQF